jgi:hypothetical protein
MPVTCDGEATCGMPKLAELRLTHIQCKVIAIVRAQVIDSRSPNASYLSGATQLTLARVFLTQVIQQPYKLCLARDAEF